MDVQDQWEQDFEALLSLLEDPSPHGADFALKVEALLEQLHHYRAADAGRDRLHQRLDRLDARLEALESRQEERRRMESFDRPIPGKEIPLCI